MQLVAPMALGLPGCRGCNARWRRALSSMYEHAAVHVERDAREVGRQVADQKEAGVGDVGGVAEPAEGNPLDDVDAHVIGELAAGDVGLNQTRRDRVDANAVGTELASHGARETQYTGFCRAVVRTTENAAAALRRYRRHADDAAAFLLFHN